MSNSAAGSTLKQRRSYESDHHLKLRRNLELVIDQQTSMQAYLLRLWKWETNKKLLSSVMTFTDLSAFTSPITDAEACARFANAYINYVEIYRDKLLAITQMTFRT